MARQGVVATDRLDLVSWSLVFVDALIANDEEGAKAELGIVFPQPFAPPPETGDVLGYFRGMIAANPADGLYLPRMIVRRADSMALGSIGVVSPDEHGLAMVGYSIYPEFERQGYASEAAAGLVAYTLDQPSITGIWATIAPENFASRIVASRAGLLPTGEMREDDGTLLEYWARIKGFALGNS